MPSPGRSFKILTGSGNVETIDVDADGNEDILEGQFLQFQAFGLVVCSNTTETAVNVFMT